MSIELSPYHQFTKEQWAKLRADEPMTLVAKDIERLRALNDPISLVEAQEIYLPLTRLFSFYVEAVQAVHHASTQFLGTNGDKVPFIFGVAGSVAAGKSTTARIMHALLQRLPNSPKVELVTTDGFLFSNIELEKKGLMEKKGFPQSYDRASFVKFLADIKSGKPNVSVPVYSHLIYDIVEGEKQNIDRPDILIVEGLNILQAGDLPKDGKPITFASDFIDFSIYIDANEKDLENWFIERFHSLRKTAFLDPNSFFHQFSKLTESEALELATQYWNNINLPNLKENVLPTRGRADLILTKSADHTINHVSLRKR